MISFMGMGFLLVKAKVADSSHAKTFSSFLIYCGTPAMFIASFQEMEYESTNNIYLLEAFLISLAVQLLIFALIALVLGRKIKIGKYKILTIGSFMGNVGFLGQPVVQALFPTSPLVSCYCMMFALSMNILVFTLGEYLISGQRKYISIKRLILNPTVLAALVALPMYALKIKLPEAAFDIVYTARSMNAPVCMLILGLRLASMNAKEVFGEPFAYLTSFMKLIVAPLITLLVVSVIPGLDNVFKVTMVIAAGTPCASVILAIAEVHDCESKRAAYSLLVSSILCVVTLPLLALIVSR